MSTLPPLADLADLAARIPGGIAEDDEARAEGALTDASVWIRAYTGLRWVDEHGDLDIPEDQEIVATICLAVARRVYDNPEGYTQESLGDWAAGRANASADAYLTRAEKARLDALGADARGRAYSVDPSAAGRTWLGAGQVPCASFDWVVPDQ